MIRTQGLAYAYAGGATLRFADVNVPQGGVLLLKGPSGAGKSTWLALAAGLVAASQGQIEVAGQVLAGGAPDRWRARSIGFLPQKLHLSAALTVHDNLALAQWAAPGSPPAAAQIGLTWCSWVTLIRTMPCWPSGHWSAPVTCLVGWGIACALRTMLPCTPAQ